MKKPPTMSLDFNKPEDARKFLRGFRMPNGAKVMEVVVSGGKTVDLATATDDQVTQYASQLYEELYVPGRGIYYFEDELLQ